MEKVDGMAASRDETHGVRLTTCLSVRPSIPSVKRHPVKISRKNVRTLLASDKGSASAHQLGAALREYAERKAQEEGSGTVFCNRECGR